KGFLVGDMIDLGSATHPALVDVNADGLLDLVVGNYGYFTPGIAQNASLYYFRNTGTPTAPKFTLENSDWLGLSEFAPNDFDFYPAFGDLDNDNDLDLLVGSTGGALYYYRNIAGPGQPMQFQRSFDLMWVLMDVGSYSTPAIVDLDSDGLKDIVMGERNGNLNFFRNTGALDNPKFNAAPTFSKLGQVDARFTSTDTIDVGFSAPVFIEQPNGALLLITGTQGGHLLAHTNVVAWEDPYPLVSETWGNIDEGNRSAPAFGDLDNDGILEMVVGNLRGGLSMFKTVLVDCTTSSSQTPAAPIAPQPQVAPNPAGNWVRVEWPLGQAVDWQAFDLLGRLVAQGQAPAGVFTISLQNWNAGAYLLTLRSAKGETARVRLIKAGQP
ncbi:MAG: T9SS type A sorting domain-containing protein, partial [Saprospiraceae bacterium]|nr:T9SS type A sorting domain-containing protein [Saprospiraceae bacterium]